MIKLIDKPLGITSYDVIRDLKKEFPGQKIGHAGTLDPLASGLLICLIGKDDTKRQSEFMGVEKEYEFDILFGFKTDSFDILGEVIDSHYYDSEEVLERLKILLKNYLGVIKQEVPLYSAVKVKGKPLYRLALDKKVENIDLPVKEVEIKSIELVDYKIVDSLELKTRILDLLDLIKSGFRNEKIKSIWVDTLRFKSSDNTTQDSERKYLIVKLKAIVSKGTYIRAIANDLGSILGTGAVTLTIRRTRVGDLRV